MIEHQSQPNKNMLFRMMEYYTALVNTFVVKEENQNKYGSKEIQIPKAEFHIVFNGKDAMDKHPKLDLGDIQLKGSVTNIHFSNLTHHDTNHSLVAYARLVELVTELDFTINDAIDCLLKEGYLVGFFGRKEIRDMFVEIFSYDQELIEQGRSEGRIEGIEQEKIKAAKKMIAKGMTAKDILEITELSEKEIEQLMKPNSY